MVALWIGFSLGSPALAQDDGRSSATSVRDRAQELYDNGKQLYDEGRYEFAIEAFRQAYELVKEPALLFNIASAHERLGQFNDAIDALSEYRVFVSAEDRETLERRIRELERRRDEAQFGSPPRTVQVPPAPNPESSREATSRRRVPALGIGLLGASAASLGAGIGLGLASQSATRTAESDCVTMTTGDDPICLTDAEASVNQSRGLALGADIAYAASAALAVTGVVVIATAPDKDNQASAHLTPGGIAFRYVWTR